MSKDILGFGQVLWDLSVYVDFDFLESELDIRVGGHRFVDCETLQNLLATISSNYPGKEVVKNSGGSCANVMTNLAKLGSKSALAGKHGEDEDGYEYMRILEQDGVKTHSILDSVNATGQLLSLITPDKDRTFIVYHGASKFLPAESVNEQLVREARLVHIEGYLFVDSKDAIWKICENARETTVDLASFAIIEKTRPFLHKMMQKHPPYILFANLQEGETFTERTGRDAILERMLDFCHIAVLTLGKEGVVVGTENGEQHFESAIPTDPADTTGAGDAFCAGFLHSFLQEKDVIKAANLGKTAASLTIRELGARSFKLKQLLKFHC